MDALNLEQLMAENMDRRTEIIVLGCAVGMLTTCRAAMLMGKPSEEIRKIAALLDTALSQSRERIQVVSGLFEEANGNALRTMEFLKSPPASAKNQ
jgi:hypothetical protein